MTARWPRLMAAAVTVIAAVMMAIYVWLMYQQGDQPVAWFIAALGTAIALGAIATVSTTRRRRVTLTICGLILVALGLLGILTIGLPLLIAGTLALVGAVSTRGPVHR